MANLVKIKMIKSKVIDGAVWLKGSEPSVDAKTAKIMIEAGEAKYAKEGEPAPATEGKK